MDIGERAEALARKMAAQLRVRGGGLAEVTRKVGRRLPRHLRAEAEKIARAEAMARHPKLGRLVDSRDLRKSEKKIARFLDRQNPASARWGEFLDLVAKIAFVVVVVVLSVFFWLLSRGYFG